jgi:hypothetical protein
MTIYKTPDLINPGPVMTEAEMQAEPDDGQLGPSLLGTVNTAEEIMQLSIAMGIDLTPGQDLSERLDAAVKQAKEMGPQATRMHQLLLDYLPYHNHEYHGGPDPDGQT